jgi:hypothetical protein
LLQGPLSATPTNPQYLTCASFVAFYRSVKRAGRSAQRAVYISEEFEWLGEARPGAAF